MKCEMCTKETNVNSCRGLPLFASKTLWLHEGMEINNKERFYTEDDRKIYLKDDEYFLGDLMNISIGITKTCCENCMKDVWKEFHKRGFYVSSRILEGINKEDEDA